MGHLDVTPGKDPSCKIGHLFIAAAGPQEDTFGVNPVFNKAFITEHSQRVIKRCLISQTAQSRLWGCTLNGFSSMK